MRNTRYRKALSPRDFVVVAPTGTAYFPPVSTEEARQMIAERSSPGETGWEIVPLWLWMQAKDYFAKQYPAIRRQGGVHA
ncbi:hypothetical protein [Pandoraea sp.]|uniref:hypothetical protein n=1 Tax=Pandoraea sp. TaxID=1883445 RepID=UPI0035B21CCE